LILSTQQANEAAPQRLGAAGAARRPPVRPHLVSSGERRVTLEASEMPGDGAVAFDHLGSATHSFEPRPWEESPALGREQIALPVSPYAPAKRILDVAGAILLAAVFSPLILAIAILMRREGGSIIYKHRRVGRDGRGFECLKFRTMVPNADQLLRELLERDPAIKAEWVRDHKLRCDPRVTRLGRFLRRTSLDELPQLWNVLRGEMSLVGPRPLVPAEDAQVIGWHRARLHLAPGLTGPWQVMGRTEIPFQEMVELDYRYLANWSLWTDLKLLIRTVPVVLRARGL
jgi:exopolysaccharide production protein ExoY